MESRMREIRTYGLTRGKSHHAPQKLRFGGYIAEGNPKGAQAGAQRRGVGLYSTTKDVEKESDMEFRYVRQPAHCGL